jgi:hypothetical protein
MTRARRWPLIVPGLALLLLDFAGLHCQREGELPGFIAVVLAQAAIYFVAVYWVLSRRPSPLWLVLLVALALRLPPLFAPPHLSTDIYRYVWDGRVQSAGINPYRYVPAAPELAGLRDPRIYPNINRREYAVTIYPPAAELFFLAVTRFSESITWMKSALLACEGLSIWLLLALLGRAGRPGAEVLLYAWHPLPLWEFAGSGHLDAAAIACVLGALLARAKHKDALAGAALGLGALFKIYPLALFFALWPRRDIRMPAALAATLCLGYLPYLGVGIGVLGFLPGYVGEEGLISGSRYYLLQLAEGLAGVQLPAAVYLVGAGLALAALSLRTWLARDAESNRGALVIGAAAMLLYSPHYSWYLVWLLPLAALARFTPVLLLGANSFVLYASLLVESGPTALWAGHLLYLPFLALSLVWLVRKQLTAASPEGPHADAAAQP